MHELLSGQRAAAALRQAAAILDRGHSLPLCDVPTLVTFTVSRARFFVLDEETKALVPLTPRRKK